jgi:hypothetical protein
MVDGHAERRADLVLAAWLAQPWVSPKLGPT